MFHFDQLFDELAAEGHSVWSEKLRTRCAEALDSTRHGDLADWTDAFQMLPSIPSGSWEIVNGRVTVSGDIAAEQRQRLHAVLKTFHPWRKGPFDLFGIDIDTEWRSDLKWNRLAGHIDLRDRSVLDIGCGNGYYGWRMLNAGARRVIGFDPFLLYVMQHEIIQRCAGRQSPNFVLPLGDDCLGPNLRSFDVTFSMGVLYHRTSPIDHLQALCGTLKPGGTLVLETLVIDAPDVQVLVPEGRYARMRNVWFIPSVSMLNLWLTRTGFTDIQVIDVTTTSTDEQRRTDWMTFESLTDFLDPINAHRTIEGYPAPVRSIVTATAKG